MAVTPKIALGIENSSSLTWSAPERFRKDLAETSRSARHHLYLVVVGPELTPTGFNALPDSSVSKLEITYGASDGPKPYTIAVPKAAFPGFTLSFDHGERALVLVPAKPSGPAQKITVAEVVRAAIKTGYGQPDWVETTMEELFTFEVAYIGQSYGSDGKSKAIDRLTQGHETVDKIMSDIQEFSRNRAVAFITLDQRLASIDANIETGPNGGDTEAIIKLMAKGWSANPLTATTVDAAEAALITAFKPKWNKLLKDFTQKEAPALVHRLKKDGYTHLRIRINLKDSYAKVKGPLRGIASSHHSWAFDLNTGAIESPGNGSWKWPLTDF